MVELNEQQIIAKDKIDTWFKETSKGGKMIFTLAGYAGTGKTFLINYLIKYVFKLDKSQIATVTPTGKAASVLIQKGTTASTIHRLIYTCKQRKRKDEKEKQVLDFIKKQKIPNKFKLIILDEVSMIGDKIMKDLISFEIPILAVGDPGQLPPVMMKRHDLLLHPDATLTEIVRQAKDNPIVQIATMAREGEYIPEGKYGDSVVVVNRNNLSEECFNNILLKADQVICGKNETRFYLNDYIRNLLGFTSKLPQENDKLICIQNNYDVDLDGTRRYNLVNGIIGRVIKFTEANKEEEIGDLKFKADFLKSPILHTIPIDLGIFNNHELKYDFKQKIYYMESGEIYPKYNPEFKNKLTKEAREALMLKEVNCITHYVRECNICQFDYGYVISCHKAQGSEFDKVVVFDESKVFPGESKRWLYTAITRAKEKLIIIR